MNGNTFAAGTLLILKEVASGIEESHGHVILEALEDDTYVLGESTQICAYLPIGVFVYDDVFKTFAPLQDPILFEGVDDDTPDDEVEELDPDSANDDVYEVVTSVPDYDAQVMAYYAFYQEIVTKSAGFESTPEEINQVRELYPEVIEMLEVMVYDALGLLDAVALMNAASYAIQEGIADERKREIAMGIFMDLYADEFGPQMFDLLEEEDDEITAPYITVGIASNVWLSKQMIADALVTALRELENAEISESDVGPGYGFVVKLDDEYIQSLLAGGSTQEDKTETVDDLADTTE
jgi:hypothetical protein